MESMIQKSFFGEAEKNPEKTIKERFPDIRKYVNNKPFPITIYGITQDGTKYGNIVYVECFDKHDRSVWTYSIKNPRNPRPKKEEFEGSVIIALDRNYNMEEIKNGYRLLKKINSFAKEMESGGRKMGFLLVTPEQAYTESQVFREMVLSPKEDIKLSDMGVDEARNAYAKRSVVYNGNGDDLSVLDTGSCNLQAIGLMKALEEDDVNIGYIFAEGVENLTNCEELINGRRIILPGDLTFNEVNELKEELEKRGAKGILKV
jgi:hypothetical protein